VHRYVLGVVAALSACGGSSSSPADAPPGQTGDAAADSGGSCTPAPADESGDGTYYAADGTGACSFDASPDDLMVAAMNAPDWNTAGWCGACVAVTGPMGSVTVRIVDECPECQHGDLDLSQEAFARIADVSAGRVSITWHEVACDVQGPIAYHFKDGSNPYYAAIQIRNHRYPIAKVEAMTGSAYAEIPRVDYNYFVQSAGLGPGPYALRVTDTRGHVLDDSGVPLGDSTTTQGAAQFPACP
jgi:expansin (peptidoglycan-binding protein)